MRLLFSQKDLGSKCRHDLLSIIAITIILTNAIVLITILSIILQCTRTSKGGKKNLSIYLPNQPQTLETVTVLQLFTSIRGRRL